MYQSRYAVFFCWFSSRDFSVRFCPPLTLSLVFFFLSSPLLCFPLLRFPLASSPSPGAELLVRERKRGGEAGQAQEVGEDAPQAGQAAGEHGGDAGEAVLEAHGGRRRALG